jgi:hypothetical protein
MRGASTQIKLSNRKSYSHTGLWTISSLTSLGVKALDPEREIGFGGYNGFINRNHRSGGATVIRYLVCAVD